MGCDEFEKPCILRLNVSSKLMRRVLYVLIGVILVLPSCDLLKSTDENSDFYDTIVDYDIQIIPVFPPLRAISIDKGQTWSLNGSGFMLGDLALERFAVSKDFVFGVSEVDSIGTAIKWFVYNENLKLCAVYTDEESLNAALLELDIIKKPWVDCREYFSALKKGGRCDWYPKVGESYPPFSKFTPKHPVLLKVRNVTGPLRTAFEGDVKFKQSHLHHFKVAIEDNSDSLLYVSFNNEPPVLIENNMELTIYNENKDYLDVAVYTPYPVAKKKGISEDDRMMTRSVVRFDAF